MPLKENIKQVFPWTIFLTYIYTPTFSSSEYVISLGFNWTFDSALLKKLHTSGTNYK